MPEQTPELAPAVAQLALAVQKGGANILMWLAATLVTVAPVAIQQIGANRESIETEFEGGFQIMGPDQAEAGSLVRLTVAAYNPTDVCWFTVGDSQKYGSQGADLVFSMPDGPAFVTCSIVRAGQLHLTQKTVGIDGEPSEPSEPTKPEEPVQPKFEPLSEIGEKVLKMAQTANLAASGARRLASNLREAATASEDANPRSSEAATASEDANPRSLVIKTTELNDSLDLPEGVTKGIQVLLQTLSENGELVNMEQHLRVWREMASGFERYADEG